MEETVSGVKSSGDWDDISEDAETVSESIEEASGEKPEGFDEWKPEEGESEADVRKRSVEAASIDGEGNVVRSFLEKIEKSVYTVMAKTNPNYFDSEEVSAALERKGSEYELRIELNDVPKEVEENLDP